MIPNKMDNSLLAVWDINRKYIEVERMTGMDNFRKKQLYTILIIVVVIFGIYIASWIKKNNACKEALAARQTTCKAYEYKLPSLVQSQCQEISEVRVSVIADTNIHKYKDLDGKPSSYYSWDDNIAVRCSGTDQFIQASDKNKLQIITDLLRVSYGSAKEVRTKASPLYDDYCKNSSGIMNLFDDTVYCETNVSVSVIAGADTYSYSCYSHYSQPKGFYKNGKWVDLSERYTSTSSKSDKSTDSKQTGSSNSKKSGSSSSSSKKSSNKNNSYDMPDCDDYEDFDDFMDNWDGCMPDGSDAEDYWEDW